MKKLEDHAAAMVYYLRLGRAIMMLTRAAARNGRGAEPVVGIVRFSGTECTRSGGSGEYCCRGCRNVGRVGVFFSGDEGSSAFGSIISR